MSAIEVTQTPEENVLRLISESNPGITAYLSGLSLGAPADPQEGVVTSNNTAIVATAMPGSGLQQGTSHTYFYNRLDILDGFSGTFDGNVYVPVEVDEQQVIEAVLTASGIHEGGVVFEEYVPLDAETPAVDGSIKITAPVTSLLYTGSYTITIKRYVPTVQDVAPNVELVGFTSPA